MNYRLAYAVGFHPWEDAEEQAAFAATLSGLLDREEERRDKPFGTALDLGCGSGVWGVWMAQRGWDVTGVDNVPKALGRAGQRSRDAGVQMRLVDGDVTRLSTSGIGGGYRLILDTGTFHGLSEPQREEMARGVTAVADEDATVLLLGWQPRRRGPLPRGAGFEDVERAFEGWSVSDEGPTNFEAPPPIELLLKPGERWYRLTRRSPA